MDIKRAIEVLKEELQYLDGGPMPDICEYEVAVRMVIDRLSAYEDTGLEPEQVEDMAQNAETRLPTWFESQYGYSVGVLMDLLHAKREGRLVVLPFASGEILVDRSNPEKPELMKNIRLALACDRNGIVFHQPFDAFLENVQRGYISQVSEEAKKMLEEDL